MAKKQKTIKPDYIYQCSKCGQIKHESCPGNNECCGKRMSLTAWTKPDKPLKLSEYGKLSSLKAMLSKPETPDDIT